MAVKTRLSEMKQQELEKLKIEIKDTSQRLIMDKIYLLKSLLSGSTIDDSKSYTTDTSYKPMFTDEDEIVVIRGKIMEQVNLL